MASRPRIWLTRPQEDSETLAALLMHHGIESIVAPVMGIRYCDLPETLPAMPDALLITSRHAAVLLKQLPEAWRSVPIYCVGAATGSSAHDAGFTTIIHGEKDILDLLPMMSEKLSAESRVVYLAGVETKVDVAALLRVKDIHVESIIAYDAVAETELSPMLREALQQDDLTGVVYFSARSAQVAAELLKGCDVTKTDAFCLSLAIAGAAGTLPYRSLHACDAPTLDAMVNLIVSRCDPKVL